MIFKFEAQSPKIDEKAYAFNTATLIGKVTVKEYASIWPGVTIRGDVNRIEVGRYSNVQDNSVLHVADEHPCIVGDYVTVGHCALLHACTVEDHVLIGMHSTVLDGAVIGTGSIVAAGAVVTKNTIVPPNSLVAGIPAKVIKTLGEKEMASIHAQAIKYKDLWTKRYGLLPDGGGETYGGEKIV
ncbi:MAG: gamma carbonic anhydrase family protein [Acidaminococcaceae bacterium]|nr:gamma carbonic anhydrase family protein [Acidaminococcaceae bacterium]